MRWFTGRAGARSGSSTAVMALLALVMVLPTSGPVSAGVAAAELPSRAEWRQDVREATAGSVRFVRRRVAEREPGERLALNLDIDNTSLATHYEPGRAVGPVLRTVRVAAANDVAILFNTARPRSKAAKDVLELRRAGYRVDEICTRRPGSGQSVVEGKQACRRAFERDGYTIIANIGNRRTDFRGGHYERAFRLPNYGRRLT